MGPAGTEFSSPKYDKQHFFDKTDAGCTFPGKHSFPYRKSMVPRVLIYVNSYEIIENTMESIGIH